MTIFTLPFQSYWTWYDGRYDFYPTVCRMITWVVFLRMFWNFISSLLMKRRGSLWFLVGTISNVLVMEISWRDVGSAGYILVSCAHSNTLWYWWNCWPSRLCKLSLHSVLLLEMPFGHVYCLFVIYPHPSDLSMSLGNKKYHADYLIWWFRCFIINRRK